MNRWRGAWGISLLVVAGCSGQSGGEAPHPSGPGLNGADADSSLATVCSTVDSRTLAVDDRAPIGFSARDMLDIAEGVHREQLVYADQAETGLRIVITYADGAVIFVDRERNGENAGPSASCPDMLQVTVGLRLVSDDGEFDESLEVVLTATQENQASFFLAMDPGELQGTFDFGRFDSGDYDERSVLIDVAFEATRIRGRLTGQGVVHADPMDSGSSGSTTSFPIGSW